MAKLSYRDLVRLKPTLKNAFPEYEVLDIPAGTTKEELEDLIKTLPPVKDLFEQSAQVELLDKVEVWMAINIKTGKQELEELKPNEAKQIVPAKQSEEEKAKQEVQESEEDRQKKSDEYWNHAFYYDQGVPFWHRV